jgi:3-oxoacyl-[acyl-carrier-protein] synthase II
LLDGHCGIVNVKERDERFAEQPCQVAAVVPKGSREDGGWTASEWLSRGVCDIIVGLLSFVMLMILAG